MADEYDEIDELDINIHRPLVLGAVVQLRSGGPWMTVRSLSDDLAECIWFNGEEVFSYDFPRTGLRPLT